MSKTMFGWPTTPGRLWWTAALNGTLIDKAANLARTAARPISDIAAMPTIAGTWSASW